ncbi:MAG: hypothetical protein AAGU75_01010 [Bacillota bacterium]
MKTRKIIIGLFVLCLIVFLFLVWPRQVNLVLKGIEYIQLNTSVADSISIKIDGQINNKFLGKREFNGRIYCDAINLNGEYFNLIFDDSNKAYLSITQKSGEAINYGEIFANKNMDELVIVKGDDILVFPSKNREVAEKIANKYFSIEYNNHFNNTN